jgi:hypothetical protein
MKILHSTLLFVILLHSSNHKAEAFRHPSSARSGMPSGHSSSPPKFASTTTITTTTTTMSPSALFVSASTVKGSNESDFSAFADSLEDDVDVGGSNNNSRSGSTTTTNTVMKPWQAKLEELLDPMTNNAQRQILLSELLTSNEEIRTSVMDAVTNRKVRPSILSILYILVSTVCSWDVVYIMRYESHSKFVSLSTTDFLSFAATANGSYSMYLLYYLYGSLIRC